MVAAVQGLAAERGARLWSCAGGDLYRLANIHQALKEEGGGTSRTISFSLGLQVFVLPEMVDKTSLVLACLESSTDIYRTPTMGQMF